PWLPSVRNDTLGTLRKSTPSIRETGSESNGGKLRSTRFWAGGRGHAQARAFLFTAKLDSILRPPRGTAPQAVAEPLRCAMRRKSSSESDQAEAPALANLLG